MATTTLPAPNAFGVRDDFGFGGYGLTDAGTPAVAGMPPDNLRDFLRQMLAANWSPGYANVAAFQGSKAINRAPMQIATKLDDGSVWQFQAASTHAADSTHIVCTDLAGGAGRWVQLVAAAT